MIEDALEADWLAGHAPRAVERYTGPAHDVSDPEADATSAGDAALEQELRSQGYIE